MQIYQKRAKRTVSDAAHNQLALIQTKANMQEISNRESESESKIARARS